MITELILQVIRVIGLAMLLCGIYAALKATKNIVNFGHPHHETDIIKKRMFPLLCWGVICLFLGNLIQVITQFEENGSLSNSGTIILWLSYVLFIFALGYFWYATKEMHHISTKERWFFAGVVGLVILWSAYLFIQIILPFASALTTLEKITSAISLILVSAMFILTFAIHPRIKAGVVDSSLGYISSGVFMYFLSFMLAQYGLGKENIIIQFASTILILISSAYLWIGFVVARKKVLKMQQSLLNVPTVRQEIGKISTEISQLTGSTVQPKPILRTIHSNKPIKK